ncbi:MAG: ribosome small subunit-dependent GTPase A [Chitinophagales bacterium]|nr:ribosome small subunit-dependent GTPase A [Chitinophagales bacterium]
MKGKVMRSTGSWYVVMTEDGHLHNCRLKGRFRLDDHKKSNPVAVGDDVEVSKDEHHDVVISKILPRNNYISRQSPRHMQSRNIIAANLDQAFLVATVANPRTSTGFIDRFLVTAEAYHIPAHIIFNKQDAMTEKEAAVQATYQEIYEQAGYAVHLVSATEKANIEPLKDLMRDKVTLVAGHSGVGKSTLINAIDPALNLRVGDISAKHLKGTHTTTFAEMFVLPFGGYIIDTPGIKEFGILDLEPEEVGHYFPEMRDRLQECQFNNCLHLDEPKCAVKDAVGAGEISLERYKNYENILNDARQLPKY